jgi:hypothetical protein
MSTKRRAIIFEEGHIEDVSSDGWVVGHFARGARQSRGVEVKWARHPEDETKDWSLCASATTLSILIYGHFRIELQVDDWNGSVDLDREGRYVIFGPNISHRWRAVKNSLILTVRWPSIVGDCQKAKP